MPTYTYKCQECGAEVDVVCPMAERNEPKQQPHIKKQEMGHETEECIGELVRGDELEKTAFTPYSWKP